MASNISLPRLIEASDDETSFGSSSFLGASLKASGANVLRYATRFQRSLSGRTAHDGIEVPGIPSVMILKRSWSAGTLLAVVRILYRPLVKSRGFGTSSSAAGPLPSPLSPWHPAHFRSYIAFPAFASPGCASASAASASEAASPAHR